MVFRLFEALKKYTEIPGPIGYEGRVQKAFIEDLKPLTEEIQVTKVGNVLAHFPGKGPRVLIFGHADEICYFVLSITEEGFLHITRYVSSTDSVNYPYCLVGQSALIIGDTEDVKGVFVAPSGHVLRFKEREMPLEEWKVLVDIGASSREEVLERGIHVGSPIVWNPNTQRLGKKAFGKAMDDRISHVVMIELAKRLQDLRLPCDLYFASTIQEEIGLKGAEELAGLGYDVTIALDIGIAGDYPSLEKGRMPIKLGEGPVIVYKDSLIHYNLEVIKGLRSTAERNGIPFQHGVFTSYGSDGATMVRGGSKTSLIAIPCRYTHTPFEMIHEDDLENTISLLFHYITEECVGRT